MIDRTFREVPYRITPLKPDGAALDGASQAGDSIAYVDMHPVTKQTFAMPEKDGESVIRIGDFEFLRYEGKLWVGEDEEYDDSIDEIDHDHFGFEIWPRVAGDPPFENDHGYLVFFHVEKQRHYTEWGHSYVRYVTHPSRKGDHMGAHVMIQGSGWGTA